MTVYDCGCGHTQSPLTVDKCRTLESIKTGTLSYIFGLNEQYCERWQSVLELLQLRDCAGNLVAAGTELVTCETFRTKLCELIGELPENGVAVPGETLLVGADCKLYTAPTVNPTVETPNTATSTQAATVTATGILNRDISVHVNISTDAGNEITLHSDGIYAPTITLPDSACDQIAAFAYNGDAVPGTIVVGADCRKYTITDPGFITVTDTSSIDLTLTGSNLEADLKLDPDGIGTITADGLLITCTDVLTCAPAVTVVDTDSINFTLTGQQITASVEISAQPENNIVVLSDGLMVSVCDYLQSLSSGGVAVPGVTEIVTADCETVTLPVAIVTTVTDTTTVDLNIVSGTISATVNVQPNTLLTTGANGLQVLCGAVQDCVFGATNNFWSYNTITNQVTFAPSTDGGNQITTGTDGKPFVPAATVYTVNDTTTVDMTLTGTIFSSDVKLSFDIGNVLESHADGLFVQGQPITLTGINQPCVGVGIAQPTPGNYEISAFTNISPDAGNILSCTANGLYASSSGSGITDLDTVSPVYYGPLTIGQVETSAVAHLDIANTDPTRSALLTLWFRWPEIDVQAAPGTYGYFAELLAEIQLPTVYVLGLSTQNRLRLTSAYPSIENASTEVMAFVIPPSFTGYFEASFRVTGEVGNITTLDIGTLSIGYTQVAI